jgi:ABC-type uncharacterized transport system auxiliary subunit
VYRSLLATVVLLCTGCFSSTPAREEIYYLLTGPTVPLERSVGPRLGVREFVAVSGYDAPGMAYRTNHNELHYWNYRRWVADPARMLTEVVIRHLRSSGHFSAVEYGGEEVRPHAVLHGQVVAIEEVDTEDHWSAHLAMAFQLRDPETQQVLLRHAFDVTRPCPEQHPRSVAATLSQILADQMKPLQSKIHGAISP